MKQNEILNTFENISNVIQHFLEESECQYGVITEATTPDLNMIPELEGKGFRDFLPGNVSNFKGTIGDFLSLQYIDNILLVSLSEATEEEKVSIVNAIPEQYFICPLQSREEISVFHDEIPTMLGKEVIDKVFELFEEYDIGDFLKETTIDFWVAEYSKALTFFVTRIDEHYFGFCFFDDNYGLLETVGGEDE